MTIIVIVSIGLIAEIQRLLLHESFVGNSVVFIYIALNTVPMPANQPLQQNPIGDFIEDDAFYRYRKALDGMDKPVMSIYIFATLSLLMFVFYILMHNESLDWFTVVINLAVIAAYFCLAAFSSPQPFTAFVITIAFVTCNILWNIIFAGEPNMRGLIIQIILIVVIASRLEDAKFVQAYKKNLVKSGLK